MLTCGLKRGQLFCRDQGLGFGIEGLSLVCRVFFVWLWRGVGFTLRVLTKPLLVKSGCDYRFATGFCRISMDRL